MKIYLNKRCKDCTRHNGTLTDCMTYCPIEAPEQYLRYINRYNLDYSFDVYPEDIEFSINQIRDNEYDLNELDDKYMIERA